ncbi:hypothetical protein SISNIDRAFT_487030 [Sistotremastrum niveocremeum HHB9708]|uniref:Dynamin N-terminal domain-containing protein n=1 Tax=Sistotremastrum niveocremeum HHB9708 TaxID=1314777 RepID=A0A164SQW2_9AGAM|nr:hypothetical protein SISNIDRAFT_487030 [Sistotremastrum niveocremeum HHB9708]
MSLPVENPPVTCIEDVDQPKSPVTSHSTHPTPEEAASILELRGGANPGNMIWREHHNSICKQKLPEVIIAVFGVTGAGKSSLLNALFDDNIVPMSGVSACTSVPIEVSYHAKTTIEADVIFLSREDWREELEQLLRDVLSALRINKMGKVGNDDSFKKVGSSHCIGTGSSTYADQIRDVYPLISRDIEQLQRLSVDELIDSDQGILVYLRRMHCLKQGLELVALLGQTKRLSATTSQSFSRQISEYVESTTSQTRNILQAGDVLKPKPNLCPLIQRVKIRCQAPCLSTGAVVVDLPGVEDSNAARCAIANDYMRKCNLSWIVGPVTRIVDDARTNKLLGDALETQLTSKRSASDWFNMTHSSSGYRKSSLTLVATKTDEGLESNIAQTLSLNEDTGYNQLRESSERLESLKSDLLVQKVEIEAELRERKAVLEVAQKTRDALRERCQFVRERQRGVKRKGSNMDASAKNVTKRPRHASDAFESAVVPETPSESADSSCHEESDEESENEDSQDSNLIRSSLERQLERETLDCERLGGELGDVSGRLMKCLDEIPELDRQISSRLQKKRAYCLLKRSEYCAEVLRENFVEQLQQKTELVDEAAKEDGSESSARDQELQDPTTDLPVFACSALEYFRITGQVKENPICFTAINETGIPALQQWCKDLAVTTRAEAAHKIVTTLNTTLKSISSYLEDLDAVNEKDRKYLREMWESPLNKQRVKKPFGAWACSDTSSDISDCDQYGHINFRSC